MTGWGGQLAFLDEANSFLVDSDVVPVRHWEPRSYGPEQHWAVPRHDHAVEQLRAVAANLIGARRRTVPLRERVLNEFAPERVAATLFDVVPELAAATGEHVATSAPSSAQSTLRFASLRSSELDRKSVV